MIQHRQPSTAKRPLRVLIVEDRENDLLLLLDELDRAGYHVTFQRVETPAALRRTLAADGWDAVLSDFSLPTMTAHDVLQIVTAVRPELPCIVLSGTITEEAAVDVLKAGARDFVVKERMTRLVPALERELRESTERRRLLASEATLQDMRERMQFALAAVGVGTWEADPRTGRTLWSEVTERLHGLEPGTFDGTFGAFIAAIHPDDRREVLDRVQRVRADGADARVEYRTTWPDGSEHWLLGIGRLLCDEHGAPVRALGVAMDITAQKLLEEQVRQSQKMESIGNLAGGIAHDFNNLLTVIAGECELMAPDVQSGAAASLEAIRSAAGSAAALTRQLLTFSRRQIVTPKVLDLNASIHGFAKILRRLVEENVRLQFRFAPRIDRVQVDPGQIEQVLLNLVANARDAMPDGGTVTIATRAVDAGEERDVPSTLPSGSYVELAVSDTGSGIPPEARGRLFEPFFTTKPVGRGTGLGLATVHGIVKQSGGHIFVQSELGAGTTFRIYLPVAAVSSVRATSHESPRPTELHGDETILVVEDSAALRQLTERILTRFGYQVLLAANGAQARQLCLDYDGAIPVLLTDVVMPDDSGPTVADWICEHRPGTKILYMSGYMSDHRVIGRGHGFLQKPFTALQLVAAVRDVLAAPATVTSIDSSA